MRFKKFTSFLLVALLVVSSLSVLIGLQPFQTTASAETEIEERYFYHQLPPEARVFYEAMYEMYTKGILKTGTDSYDLTENGFLTQDDIAAYGGGGVQMLSMFGAARDAFYFDYPDIFYVDFSSLSIRVTMDSNGQYHAYLGSGRRDNYYNTGFTSAEQVESAVSAFTEKIDEIADEARNIEVDPDKSLEIQQVEFVHDYITHHTSYRLENACKPENIGYIRNAYGPIMTGEGVCEGYARALKTILDELNIPNVLVQGVYRHTEEVVELHMWNYVQINGIWYAVDATMDDPIGKTSDNGVDGYEGNEYLLVGEIEMSRHHAPSGIVSEANFEFVYPSLTIENAEFDVVYNNNGLTVQYNHDGEFEDIPAGMYHVSYEGMGPAEAAKQGKYFLARYYNYYENTDEWIYSDWAYILSDIFPSLADMGSYVIVPLPHVKYVEFAITDIAPGPYLQDPKYLRYLGDPFLLESTSGMLYNSNGSYVAPPYIKKQTPASNGRIYIGEGSHHVTVEYDDKLIENGKEKVECVVDCYDPSGRHHTTGLQNCKFENFQWDGDRTISFDFEPSVMWMDDCVMYTFNLKGLVGARSLKVPNSISYYAAHRCAVCAYKSQGYDWNIFGKPALLENSDLSTNGWMTSEGVPVDEGLKSRMVLVATKPTNSQTQTMEDLIENNTDAEILSSETYNINLTLCKSQVIQTGQGVRVSVGFPEGYGPEDAGVTFKAYHFKKNDYGEVVEVEEIPCVITPYGLLITCSSFSPFAIVAVEDDGKSVSAEKTVIISNTMGGSLSGTENMFSLSEGEKATVTITADQGYDIDYIVVGGEYLDVTNNNSMTVEISYDDLNEGSNIVDAKFVAEAVHEQEIKKGETVVQPQAVPAEIQIDAKNMSAVRGNEFTVEPRVIASGDAVSYQWYKDDVALPNQTAKELKIDKVSDDDAGIYYLVVTTYLGSASAQTQSSTINVSVSEDTHVGGTATCTEPARCEICGNYYGDPDADNHSFIDYISDNNATCTQDGTKTATCKRCGATDTIPDEGSALGHNYVSYVVEPSCESGGYTEYICSHCDEHYEDDYTDALGHDFGDWKVIESPDCDDDGVEQRTCNICGITENRNVDESGHQWEENYTIDKPATCTEDGSESIHCANCDATKDSRIIEETGHNPITVAKKENEIKADCKTGKDGSYEEVITCEDCNTELSRETKIIKAEHDYRVEVIDPDCANGKRGFNRYTCLVCSDSYIDEDSYVEPEHHYGRWTSVKEASCTENGIEKHTCVICSYEEEREIVSSGHDWENEFTVDVEATCTTEGSRSIHCRNCEETKEISIIPVIGHSAEIRDAKAESCTEEGYTGDLVCRICNNVLETGAAISQTEHVYENGQCVLCGAKENTSTDPDSTDPDSTDPDSTDPDSTKPESTEPQPDDSKPTEPDTVKPNSGVNKDNTPDTGESSNAWLWLSALLISALGLSAVAIFRKQKRNE